MKQSDRERERERRKKQVIGREADGKKRNEHTDNHRQTNRQSVFVAVSTI